MKLTASLLWLGLCGFTTQPLDAARTALINHYTNNDPAWAVLSQAIVATDLVKGVYSASFPPTLRALDGHAFRISGYMTPLEPNPATGHFIITRRSTTCPFFPPNGPTEAVEVWLGLPTRFTPEEVAVSGRLKLVASSDQGLFYRLDAGAMIATAPR